VLRETEDDTVKGCCRVGKNLGRCKSRHASWRPEKQFATAPSHSSAADSSTSLQWLVECNKPFQRENTMAIKHLENEERRQDEAAITLAMVPAGNRREEEFEALTEKPAPDDRPVAAQKVFRRVRFTGQQPGEEGVEKDEESEEPEDDEDGEKVIPINEPPANRGTIAAPKNSVLASGDRLDVTRSAQQVLNDQGVR
jgi:hypothetical protein